MNPRHKGIQDIEEVLEHLKNEQKKQERIKFLKERSKSAQKEPGDAEEHA